MDRDPLPFPHPSLHTQGLKKAVSHSFTADEGVDPFVVEGIFENDKKNVAYL